MKPAWCFPNAEIDGIEIDPKIVEVGEKYFALDTDEVNIIIQDGRWAMKNSTKHYDIISVDAYRPPYIPWHMTTVEFFTTLQEHLAEDGVVVINVGQSSRRPATGGRALHHHETGFSDRIHYRPL